MVRREDQSRRLRAFRDRDEAHSYSGMLRPIWPVVIRNCELNLPSALQRVSEDGVVLGHSQPARRYETNLPRRRFAASCLKPEEKHKVGSLRESRKCTLNCGYISVSKLKSKLPVGNKRWVTKHKLSGRPFRRSRIDVSIDRQFGVGIRNLFAGDRVQFYDA